MRLKKIEIINKASRKKMEVKAFLQVIIPVLLIIITLFLTACSRSTDYLYKFNTALEEDRLADANEIFAKSQNDSEDNTSQESFFDAVKPYLENVINSFKNNEISYDLAIVELDNYKLGREFSSIFGETIDKYQEAISTVDSNAQLKVNAETFSKVGDHLRSIKYYDEILRIDPENTEIIQARSSEITAFLNDVITKVKAELNAGYPATAIVVIDQATELVGENEELKNLRKQAEDKIKEQRKDIQNTIIKNTFDAYLHNGNLSQAEDFIASLKDRGVDVTEYEALLEESKKQLIDTILTEAENLVGSLSGRWQSNPYAQAIAKLEEGLAMFPNNQAMQDAKTKYESMVPTNLSGSIYDVEGKVESGARGRDATGFEHSPSDFNRAIYARPDSSFKFDVNDSRLRILAIPQTDNESVYKGSQMQIKINESIVYDSSIFSEDTSELLFEYDVTLGSAVEISIVQSGFASFFDRILGRNGVYFEIFGY